VGAVSPRKIGKIGSGERGGGFSLEKNLLKRN
jgi:hypothetical protein